MTDPRPDPELPNEAPPRLVDHAAEAKRCIDRADCIESPRKNLARDLYLAGIGNALVALLEQAQSPLLASPDPRDANDLARQVADLRDELDTERQAHAETREQLAVVDAHRTMLSVVAEEARKVATALGRIRNWRAQVSPEVRTDDLWRPVMEALAGLEKWLSKLDDEERA